jgi:hypothetical protein
MVSFMPWISSIRKELPAPTAQVAGWTSELVWMLSTIEKALAVQN